MMTESGVNGTSIVQSSSHRVSRIIRGRVHRYAASTDLRGSQWLSTSTFKNNGGDHATNGRDLRLCLLTFYRSRLLIPYSSQYNVSCIHCNRKFSPKFTVKSAVFGFCTSSFDSNISGSPYLIFAYVDIYLCIYLLFLSFSLLIWSLLYIVSIVLSSLHVLLDLSHGYSINLLMVSLKQL
jgi:hypothetical protein